MSYHELLARYDLLITMVFLAGLAFRRFNKLPLISFTPPLLLIYLIWIFALIPKLTSELWYDEAFAVVTSRLPLSDMFRVLQSDVHPPLHYLITHVVTRFSDNQIVVRIPSVIAGAIAIYIIFRLSRSNMITAVIAISPVYVHYSAEARYPIFLVLSVLAAVYTIQNRSVFQIFFIACTHALHATGYIYAVVLIALGLKNKRYAIINIAIIALSLPYTLQQSSDVVDGFWLTLRSPIWHLLPTGEFTTAYMGIIIAFLTAIDIRPINVSSSYLMPFSVFLLSVVWHPVYLARALVASFVLSRFYQPTILTVFVLFLSWGAYLSAAAPATYRHLFDLCDDLPIVTTSTNMAIIADYYTGSKYTYAIDTAHQWLSDDAKNALSWVSPITHSMRCTVIQRTYATMAAELISIRGNKVATVIIDSFTKFEVYHVR